jgi:hypothetical protein
MNKLFTELLSFYAEQERAFPQEAAILGKFSSYM